MLEGLSMVPRAEEAAIAHCKNSLTHQGYRLAHAA